MGKLMVALLLVVAAAAQAQERPKLVFFHSETCAMCVRAKPMIDDLEANHPKLTVERHEVTNDPEGRELFRRYLADYGAKRIAVPAIFYGSQYWIGYSAKIQRAVAAAVSRQEQEDANTVHLPIVGEVALSDLSVVAATAVVALVDGFNPCSLWLLTFLLGVVVHTRSRTSTIAVGLTFLTVTASIYGLFIVGLFGMFVISDASRWIRYGVVVLALVFGVLNIKDYFVLGRGPSLTISREQKRAVSKGIQRLMTRRDSTVLLVLSTVALAAGVTFIELPCTAGFPVIWSRIVAAHGIRGTAFGSLLALYLIIYLADELTVLCIATVTLRRAAFEEKHGRLLKLLGGSLMAGLGLAMLVAPLKGSSVQGVVIVFAAALAATAVTHLITRRFVQTG